MASKYWPKTVACCQTDYLFVGMPFTFRLIVGNDDASAFIHFATNKFCMYV